MAAHAFLVPLQVGGAAAGILALFLFLIYALIWLAIPVGVCLVGVFLYDRFVAPDGVDAARVAELERDVAELRLEIERR